MYLVSTMVVLGAGDLPSVAMISVYGVSPNVRKRELDLDFAYKESAQLTMRL